MGQLIFMIALGLFFVGLGFFVRRFPMMIAGYNTLPKEEREKVDTVGLAQFMRNGLVGIGILLILIGLFTNLTGLTSLTSLLIPLVFVGGYVVLLIGSRRYSKGVVQSKKSKQAFYIIIIVVAITGSIFYSGRAAQISVDDQSLIIKGSYGLTIPLQEITKVEQREQIPPIIMKTNGIGFWKYNKGHFHLEKLGNATLFLNSGHGPYLLIYSSNHDPIIINRSSPEEIRQLYEKLTH